MYQRPKATSIMVTSVTTWEKDTNTTNFTCHHLHSSYLVVKERAALKEKKKKLHKGWCVFIMCT